MKRKLSLWFALILVIVVVAGGFLSAAAAQSNPTPPAQPVPAQSVPTVDGGLGRCSLELTILAPDGKPAAAATAKMHIVYGFGGFHKLDLEAGANAEGKVKFTGLPSSVRRPPLEVNASGVNASKDQLVGTAEFDPATECHSTRSITLAKQSASQP